MKQMLHWGGGGSESGKEKTFHHGNCSVNYTGQHFFSYCLPLFCCVWLGFSEEYEKYWKNNESFGVIFSLNFQSKLYIDSFRTDDWV